MREVPCMLSGDLVVWNGDSMFNFSLPFEVPKMTKVDYFLSLGIIYVLCSFIYLYVQFDLRNQL